MITRTFFATALSLMLLPLQAQSDEVILADGSNLVITGGGGEIDLATLTGGHDPTEIRMDEGLIIWPVPVKDVMYIHYGEGSGNLPFEIVNITGRVVMRGAIVGGNVNMIEFDTAAKGDHVLRVVDSKGIHSIAFMR